jgi:Protein of unknown function (DUF2845)
MNHRPEGRRTRRSMAGAWVVVAVLTAMVGGTPGLAWALDCEGRLVSEGQTLSEVYAICGTPAQVDDSLDIILQLVYDPFGRVVDHLPVAVPKSLWIDHVGPSRLVYRLTFRDGKLVHIETGGYGH